VTDAVQRWPGERLGLPEQGPRSIARVGRRLVALAIDWAAVSIISIAVFGLDYPAFAPLGFFAVEQIVFLLLLNGSPGHLVMGLRVVPIRGGYLGLWRPLVRTLLLCVVIPAVIWDRDQRGLHDRLVGTVLVRR
jgi:uncharacterized RDD family membrane protein YckC